MAKSVNKVFLLGNVGRPPDFRNTRSGIAAELSLATNEGYPDGHGGWKSYTEWHTLVAFGRTAEVIRDYVHSGSLIFIIGKLHTESWDDPNFGLRRYWTKILVLELSLLSCAEQSATDEKDPRGLDDASPYAHIPDGPITAEEIPF